MYIENKVLELKERMPSKDQLKRTAVAFANGAGGEILIGIKSDGKTVVGIEIDKYQETEEEIANIIFDSIYPPIIPHISLKHVDEKPVVSIEIMEGSLPPYHIKKEGNEKGVYVRVGSTTRRADGLLIQSLKLKSKNLSYDSTSLYDADISDIRKDICKEFISNRKNIRGIPEQIIDSGFFKHYFLAGKGHERNKPTVGGILLFSNRPSELLPFSTIKCARFKGVNNLEYIDEMEFDGHLVDQIEKSIQFVKRNINKKMFISGNKRVEEYEYPIPAIREIVVNAVCHRDYLAHHSSTKISIYDDRIEVINPGSLPPHLSVEDLGKGISEIRNPVIARVLRDWGYIEEWGKGISKVVDLCMEKGLSKPQFSEEGLFFKVILRKAPSQMTETQRKILEFVPYDNVVSANEIEKIINLHRNSILNALKKLLSSGYVEKSGSGRSQRYKRIK